ncbi:MAG: hypothetical protein IJQ05_01125 [Bacteroidaceae bacterium]|nr:hypothetical protein [Bacteroidaceae bacterium]
MEILSVMHESLVNLYEYEHNSVKDISLYLCSYFDNAILLGLCSAIIAIACLFIANRYINIWKIFSRYLFALFGFVWLCGFSVYDVGMYTGEKWSLVLNVPMAMLYAFGMFILDSDISAIHDEFYDNAFFMACFSTVHFCAACVSMIFIIKHFGYNIIAGLRMYFAAWLSRKKDITYVFWGMNDATFHLANSIKDHHQGDRTSRIIVVRNNGGMEGKDVRNGMYRLFNFLSVQNSDLNKLIELECLATTCFGNLPSTNNVGVDAQMPDKLRDELNMRQLCRIIKRKTNREVHFFFLSDDEQNNIKSVSYLKMDKTINDFINRSEGRKIVLYCHTRNNSINRVIEFEQPISNIEVKVVDPSSLCIDLFKNKADLHPVNYVDIENDATVSSPFNALVVGFGHLGYDVVRFLYEFAAFVKTGSTSQKVIRSDFHCDVVDKNMSDLAGTFVANAPAIKTAMPFNDDDNVNDSLITLHEMNCNSISFYEKLDEWIKKLNYIVITTGDDELNVSLAVRILRLAIRYRENMDHFRILVRVSKDENLHVRNIVHFYNRLWESELKKNNDDGLKRQRIVPSSYESDTPITLFGAVDEIYQYDYIVNDQLRSMSKLFKERYDKSIQELQKQSGDNVNSIVSWDDEYKQFMQLDTEYAGYSPTYSNLMKLRRMQSQNYENCFHVHTKRRLAMCALGADDYAVLTAHQLFRRNNETSYQWKSHVQPKTGITKVLDTLAQTEHLRWIASHEVLGYQDEGNEKFKDEAKMLHGCMKAWEKLSAVTKSYDYNVVDVSLDIIELTGR